MDTTAERIAILNRLHHKWMRDLLSVAGVNPDVAFATAQALRDLETYIWHVEHEHEQALPLPLNCPKCGRSMAYIITSNDTYIYRCDRHGTVILPPDGRVRVDDPHNSAVRNRDPQKRASASQLLRLFK